MEINNTDLDNYKQRRDKVCDLLGKAQIMFQEFEPNTAATLGELKENTSNGKFSIIVAGQFSSGKSTFLNALMGEKYLPSFTKETTATINELKSVHESPTGKPAVRVNYIDGRVVTLDDVSLENISKYVCTDGDDVINTIRSVELFIDSPFLNNGVRLIDTPGLNGIAEGHTEVTRREFGQCHAGIFMFNSGAAGSGSDYKILREMKSFGSSILFVLNQIDLIKEEEHETPESVIENLRNGYSGQFPEEPELPEIWPISAYQALVGRNSANMVFHEKTYESKEDREEILMKSRIVPFENRLMRYLTQGERAKAELLSPINQLVSKISKYRTESIEKPLSILNSDVEAGELTARKEELEKTIKEIREKNNRNLSSLKVEVGNVLNNTEDSIKAGCRDIKRKYLDKVGSSEGELDDFESDSKAFLRRMEREYRDHIETAIDDLDRSVLGIISEKCSEYQSVISERSLRKSGSVEFDSVKLDSSLFEVDIEIKSYSQLDDLYSRHDQLATDVVNEQCMAEIAESNVLKLKDIENQGRNIKDYYRAAEMDLGLRPEEEYKMRMVRRKVGGLKGFGKWITTGSRQENDVEEYCDRSRQEAYDRKLNDLREQRNSELEEYYAEKSKLRNMDTDSTRHRMEAQQKEQERQNLERKIEQIKQKCENELSRELRKRVRAAKEHVEECLEALDKSVRKVTVNTLRERRDSIAEHVNKVIDDVLAMSVAEKEQELSSVIRKIASGAEEIAKEKKRLGEIDDRLRSLLEEAVYLRRELEDIPTDTIEQE